MFEKLLKTNGNSTLKKGKFDQQKQGLHKTEKSFKQNSFQPNLFKIKHCDQQSIQIKLPLLLFFLELKKNLIITKRFSTNLVIF